jgi:uncharacterized protein YndB with AHSA1/START domain
VQTVLRHQDASVLQSIMENLRFSVDVDAPAQQVWNVMLDLDTYRQWTGAFHEGSTYEGGWNEGDEIRFLGPNDDGTASGLFGTIVANRPHEFVSIRYLGDIENDVENRDGPAVGLHESYSFTETDGVTTLVVELEVPDEWADDMRAMWSEAIVTIKQLAERPTATKS